MHFSEREDPNIRPTAREIVFKMCKQQRLLRVLANGAGDSARRRRVGRPARSRTRRRRSRRRRHGKIGENAPWLQNIIITAAAGSTDRRAGGPPRADGPERGRACSRAATEVARKTQRNDGQAWHIAGRETEREIMRLWTLLERKSFPLLRPHHRCRPCLGPGAAACSSCTGWPCLWSHTVAGCSRPRRETGLAGSWPLGLWA